ncbi:MAG: rane protein involved in aromatic hydrocarbon degradation [Betaproteobacteria bacterium]|nr:rane protein involved in aromatic hydrocarbon degradation [Betaproteobacteria bacterium]
MNPSVAYKVNEMISVGAGINYQRADATLSNAVNFGPAGEGMATVKGDDSAWGYNVGLMFDLSPATRIGLAYRSALKYTLTGDVTFSNLPPGVGALAPDGPVRADIKLPSSASLSLFHKIDPKWDVLADVSWTDWSTLKSLDVFRTSGALLSTTPLNWKDTWRVGVGANYHHNDMWTLRFGVAYDQSPVPDADRTPRIPDQDRFWLALGAQYRVSKQLAVDFGYAHLFVKDASVDLCRSAAQPGCGTARNNLVGNYNSNKVDIISAQVRYAF